MNITARQIERASQDKQPEIGLVQGKMPDSKNEWYFALACDKLELEYIFQYQIGGGERGSQWVDFLVMTGLGWAACYIQGAHWHTRETRTEDTLKQQVAAYMFGQNNVFEFNDEETESIEAAVVSIKKKLVV